MAEQSAPLIVVLEDNLERRAAMTEEVGDLANLQFFGGVPEFELFVRDNRDEIAVISLDHDLSLPQAEERMLTPDERLLSDQLGNGVMACEKLLDIFSKTSFPQLVVHTSNNGRRFKMLSILDVDVPEDLHNGGNVLSRDGRRNVTVVFPYNDVAWVEAVWGPTIRSMLTPANEDC